MGYFFYITVEHIGRGLVEGKYLGGLSSDKGGFTLMLYTINTGLHKQVNTNFLKKMQIQINNPKAFESQGE